MIIKPQDIKANEFYGHLLGCITPRPIAWVSTLSKDGIANLAPFSFFSGIAASPPTLLFTAVNKKDGSKKDTLANIEATQEFVVNIATYDNKDAMNQSAAEYVPEEDEFAICDLTPGPGSLLNVPHVASAPIHMECTLNQIVHIGEGPLAANIIIGNIVSMYIKDEVLNERGQIDARKLDIIGRLSGNAYVRCNQSFDLPRPRL